MPISSLEKAQRHEHNSKQDVARSQVSRGLLIRCITDHITQYTLTDLTILKTKLVDEKRKIRFE